MLIGAHAYFWYKGEWLKQTARPDDPPVIGEYDNTWSSPALPWQMEQAKSAGLDFLVVSWSHRDDVEHAMDAAAKAGIGLTTQYESLTRARAKKNAITEADMPAVLDDVRRMARDSLDYGGAWLRVGGRPAFIIYVTRCYESPSMIDRVREAMSKELGEDVFLVGDELFWRDVPEERLRVLDAATAYNMYKMGEFDPSNPGPTFLENSRAMMLRHKAACEKAGVSLWGSAMPGYDDRGYRPQERHEPIPRSLEFFRRSLEDGAMACAGDHKVMVVTSFSEWYEDTQVEAASSYGYEYLEALKSFTRS